MQPEARTYDEDTESGRLEVNWWAVLGGVICAVVVLAEIAFVWWVVSW